MMYKSKRVKDSDLSLLSRNIRNSLDLENNVLKRLQKTDDNEQDPYNNMKQDRTAKNSYQSLNYQRSIMVTASTINASSDEDKEVRKLQYEHLMLRKNLKDMSAALTDYIEQPVGFKVLIVDKPQIQKPQSQIIEELDARFSNALQQKELIDKERSRLKKLLLKLENETQAKTSRDNLDDLIRREQKKNSVLKNEKAEINKIIEGIMDKPHLFSEHLTNIKMKKEQVGIKNQKMETKLAIITKELNEINSKIEAQTKREAELLKELSDVTGTEFDVN